MYETLAVISILLLIPAFNIIVFHLRNRLGAGIIYAYIGFMLAYLNFYSYDLVVYIYDTPFNINSIAVAPSITMMVMLIYLEKNIEATRMAIASMYAITGVIMVYLTVVYLYSNAFPGGTDPIKGDIYAGEMISNIASLATFLSEIYVMVYLMEYLGMRTENSFFNIPAAFIAATVVDALLFPLIYNALLYSVYPTAISAAMPEFIGGHLIGKIASGIIYSSFILWYTAGVRSRDEVRI